MIQPAHSPCQAVHGWQHLTSSHGHLLTTLAAHMQEVYKDKMKIIRSIKDNMPGYKNFTEYEFGFKVRDKDRPESWIDADEVVILPEPEEVPEGPLEGLKASVGSLFNKN